MIKVVEEANDSLLQNDWKPKYLQVTKTTYSVTSRYFNRQLKLPASNPLSSTSVRPEKLFKESLVLICLFWFEGQLCIFTWVLSH